MSTLILHVRKKWFDAIKSGEKTEEYRIAKPYWKSRIEKPGIDRILLVCGYAPLDHPDRVISLPWKGYEIRTITHEEFGPKPVQVYVIYTALDQTSMEE